MPTSTTSSAIPRNIVIVGGGIIGVCTAYYLVTDPSLPEDATVTLVEGTCIAAGASGHAGGFLARDDKWFNEATLGMS
jgi:glycine/D-amino acid oxidase-like deaminating enzyme